MSSTTAETGEADEGRLEIVLIGDPILRRGTRQVEDFGAARDLLGRMATMLREIKGAGLAAPQVGSDLAALVVEVRPTEVQPDRPSSPLIQMINPRITFVSVEREPGWEGCFSVPNLMGVVERPVAIDVEYRDVQGEPRSERFEGYLARVIQHEIDHLNGIFFLDRMPSMASLTTVENFQRFYAGDDEEE